MNGSDRAALGFRAAGSGIRNRRSHQIGRPGHGTPFTAATIAPHIDGVCAAIELVDDRSADYANLDVLSLVADNSWNAGIVLSEFSTKWPDLEGVFGRATKDRVAIGEGHGRDILGHPFNSVAWLATQLASRGTGLKAGEVVMTGSVMKTVFPEADASYRFELEPIGSVEVQVRNLTVRWLPPTGPRKMQPMAGSGVTHVFIVGERRIALRQSFQRAKAISRSIWRWPLAQCGDSSNRPISAKLQSALW